MKKVRISTIFLILIFFTGLSLLLYPTVSDYWNSLHQARAIATYADKVATLEPEDYSWMLEEAAAYNDSLKTTNIRFSLTEEEEKLYNSILNVSGDGMMGYIEIPSINCSQPIYHGTGEAVLQIAIGHIAGTSLPVGGIGTHTVLSGHRGLPSAKLFTDLDKLKNGDIFVLRVLDETMTYEVDQILIVEPNQTEALAIDPAQDYCTLVTCTPYGINTHRLLVRGHRIANVADSDNIRVTADAMQIDPVLMAPILAAPLLVILLILLLVSGRRSRRTGYREKQKGE